MMRVSPITSLTEGKINDNGFLPSERGRQTRLDALMRYWNEKRGNAAMPSRAEIDPVELRRLLPIVLMAEIVDADIRISLLGSETTAVYGSEMRGHRVGDFSLDSFMPVWLESFDRAARSPAPVAASGFFVNGIQRYRADLVLMPLSEDGITIDRIFGGLILKSISQESALKPQSKASYTIYNKNRMFADGAKPSVPLSIG